MGCAAHVNLHDLGFLDLQPHVPPLSLFVTYVNGSIFLILGRRGCAGLTRVQCGGRRSSACAVIGGVRIVVGTRKSGNFREDPRRDTNHCVFS